MHLIANHKQRNADRKAMYKHICISKEHSFIMQICQYNIKSDEFTSMTTLSKKVLPRQRLAIIIRNRTIMQRTRTKAIPKKGKNGRHQGKRIARRIRRRIKMTAMDISGRPVTRMTPLTHWKLEKNHRRHIQAMESNKSCDLILLIIRLKCRHKMQHRNFDASSCSSTRTMSIERKRADKFSKTTMAEHIAKAITGRKKWNDCVSPGNVATASPNSEQAASPTNKEQLIKRVYDRSQRSHRNAPLVDTTSTDYGTKGVWMLQRTRYGIDTISTNKDVLGPTEVNDGLPKCVGRNDIDETRRRKMKISAEATIRCKPQTPEQFLSHRRTCKHIHSSQRL